MTSRLQPKRVTRGNAVVAAAIYLRISQDRTGENLGVERQRLDCEAFCAARGWMVAHVFIENDTSASTRKPRPVYEEMLRGVEAGKFDAVVAWVNDRLMRRKDDLERFIDLVERTQIQVGMVRGGLYDLTTPNGRLNARLLGAVAQHETEQKADRQRNQQAQAAVAGKLSGGGGHRPFGYERDRLTVREDEAVVVRDLARRFLAGESFWSLCGDLNGRGIKTTTGRLWRPATVRQLLVAARLSGRREHHGDVVATAVWPAIISPSDSDAIRAMVANPNRRTTPGNARSHLLSGFLRCGRCGASLVAHRQRNGDRYGCYRNGNKMDCCGRLTVLAAELEAEVVTQVCHRLDGPALSRGVATHGGSPTDADEDLLRQAIAKGERELEEMAELRAAGEIDVKEWMTVRRGARERVDQATKQLDEIRGLTTVTPWIGHGQQLLEGWEGHPLFEQRACIASVVDHIVILPSRRGANRFDPCRVQLVWRA